MKSATDTRKHPPRSGPTRSSDIESWIEDHHARIYAYLRRRCRSDVDAADLTQQTFTRAWTAQDRFEGRSSVVSWLHGIAHHVWLDWRRKGGRFEERPDAWWEQLPGDGVSPAESFALADSAAAVFQAVEGLEEDQRATVHLHYYQGLSLQETAEVLEIATSTVKYRLREALARIQRAISEDRPNTQPKPSTRD